MRTSKNKKSTYSFDKKTPVATIRRSLVRARRRRSSIYIIARIIQVLLERKVTDVKLTPKEQRRLAAALYQARYGKTLPLADWLPRGYQIVRLIATIKIVMPKRRVSCTERDARMIRKAEQIFLKNSHLWNKVQLKSLYHSAQFVGLDRQLKIQPPLKKGRFYFLEESDDIPIRNDHK